MSKDSQGDQGFPPRPTWLAAFLLKQCIRPGDLVIDATAGNGHDTVWLAECVGAGGRVLAFDIQRQAIQSAQARVAAAGVSERVDFFQCGHEHLGEHVSAGSVSAVVFNLGYLPGGNHELATLAPTTLLALRAAAVALRSGGALFVTCYPGHAAGAGEAENVRGELARWAQGGWKVASYALPYTLRPAPELWLAGKPRVAASAAG